MTDDPAQAPSTLERPEDSVAEARRLLAAAGAALGDARARLDRNEQVDLASLPRLLDQAMTRLGALPSEAGAPLEPVLLGLLDDLDRLRGRLVDSSREVRQELEQSRSYAQASRAYNQGRRD